MALALGNRCIMMLQARARQLNFDVDLVLGGILDPTKKIFEHGMLPEAFLKKLIDGKTKELKGQGIEVHDSKKILDK